MLLILFHVICLSVKGNKDLKWMHFFWKFDNRSREQMHRELILCEDVQTTVSTEPEKCAGVCV